jgi:hypothetical protein
VLAGKNMAMIGTVKNGKRRVAGIMHVIVYVGFIIINIELLEIIIDGLFGTHQYLPFLALLELHHLKYSLF